MSLLATDEEKADHARKQGAQWLQHRGEITGIDSVTREKGKWKVVLNDSPKKLVHDPSRPILVNRVKKSVYDRGNVADDVLERPLRNFFVIPEGCWRPWDLHPEATARTGKCVVSMLYSSFTKRNKKRVIENGRTRAQVI